ncbi:MAG: DVU_1551 family NTP transferase [Pseudomonadota bacterium]
MHQILKKEMNQDIDPAAALSVVIPAAGFSSRMHGYKPLLKLGDKTMIEVVIQLFKGCGITDIIVVTGHNRDCLTPCIQKAGARTIFNPDYETGMFGSIQKGAEQVSPQSCGFFLLPVDIPAIRPATILALWALFKKHPDHIIIPEFERTPGHPPIIPARLIPKITAMRSDSNLGKLLLSQTDRLVRLPVYDRGILLDADTQTSYEAVAQKYQQMHIPDLQECHCLIQSILPGETAIQSHLLLVAKTALKLGRAIVNNLQPDNKKRLDIPLNMNLIQAAALLHDIKRKEKNHALAGSRFLESFGYFQAADIVAEHMTLTPGDTLTEKEIVYFADKLCIGNRLELDYRQRFIDKCQQEPWAKTPILKRYEITQQIQSRIQAAAGRSIREILQ